ncbi:hypothetical protein BT67DRAFT_439468 [Trichocladium antarcticum]|uniref:Uncharacterized protein n=1 Tax=Trichocladium antarcticum TaxID=1450529 RepID=A0AAN6ZFI6_9PEZI|nr:hypothetical protein BT67DRAFT_439468 [Trichocladium antarcticum]
MYLRPCCSLQNTDKTRSAQGRWHWLSETLEIGIAALCSTVTWEYTVQNDVSQRHDSILEQHAANHTDGFLFRPSPGLMLLSCLVFGCCVSSFTHRRQSQDPLQFVVFVLLLGSAAMAGYGVRENVHLVLLGYLPWATCAAMAVSISAHSVHRWLRLEAGADHGDEEKVRLVG